jgi:hypothetical protein
MAQPMLTRRKARLLMYPCLALCSHEWTLKRSLMGASQMSRPCQQSMPRSSAANLPHEDAQLVMWR